MEESAGDALAEMVRSQGPSVLDDPRKVRAMLRDAAPSARLEVSLLTAAVEEGIPDRLNHTSIGLVGGEIERLAGRLVADRGLAPANADWAVRTIAWVLGMGRPTGPPGSGPGSPLPPSVPVRLPVPAPDERTSWPTRAHEEWSWVDLPGQVPQPPVDAHRTPRPSAPSRRGVRTGVIAAVGVLVLVVAGGAVWFSTRSEATASFSAPVQHLLAALPEEYSEDGVCHPWSDSDRAPLAAPLAAVECDPGQASWPESGLSPDLVRFEDYGSDEAAVTALMTLERAGSDEPCPDAAYAPQPAYDGEGFRERYSCSPTADGRLRLMRVWERGVIGVVYPEPDDLDAHYAWFEGPQAPA